MHFKSPALITAISFTLGSNAQVLGFWNRPAFSACPSISPGPATLQQLSELPLAFRPDPDTESAIRQTLSLYPFAVDGRNFDALDRIFTPNVRTNYSEPINEVVGLTNIKAAIAAGLDNFAATHHSFGTQYIVRCAKDSAISVTYYTASHYFHPSKPAEIQNGSEVLYATGRYEDTWERQGDGGWKIANRNLVYQGPLIYDR
ncbi:uncharacterized protein HMPREF1541_02445 [Cyphellophora europaea CBS 101466]|uniref:SnoaL-like domain-containing protein n=1 Tax=Cyphellophora europaea (strain CBS 101466) TaxID=1220924 RepID=W2S3K3_CYPE1|nr:uncharacterized protein HMPREF1541_02445 [Cyphellophora europaea CBS 101466]ETN43286.1 hypothetical protein HMPREF1541_02445 [Cyphellophora europaea CBS 101466]